MEENLKVTCLHDRHVALGAKMSPFAGFSSVDQMLRHSLTLYFPMRSVVSSRVRFFMV